ncbi:MAG: 1-deoxy-D-xylulose-5-phosphate reductoisomerase [Syntrophaceae bacterium]|nr:1-deoxy-D-xylulose-5-phosphate reductoisomerase [Syntrophaceae bacterium]
MKNLSILGSTGSIGINTLNVVRENADRFRISGLAAGNNVNLLKEQILEFRPRQVSVATDTLAAKLKALLPLLSDLEIISGEFGCAKIATIPEVNLVVSAMVGARGLVPTIRAIEKGKDIALANKETLVMAGQLVMNAAKKNKVRIIPVDSEHSAIFQCLKGNRKKDVKRIILTASGGPFREMQNKDLCHVTVEQALQHPRWQMGKKITIDSATMMNKGLEILEAKWLFDLDYDQIDVHIHPQSIVHSLVEYHDGAILAQMGLPDMKVPIAYALSYPSRLKASTGVFLDILKVGALEFHKADREQFTSLDLAYKAGSMGGTMPAVMNGANEIAVEAFLHHRISFLEIVEMVGHVMSKHDPVHEPTLEDILTADGWARSEAEKIIEERIDHC